MAVYGQQYVVEHYECQRQEYDEEPGQVSYIGIAGEETLYETCHNEDGDCADDYLHGPSRSTHERFHPGICARKEPAIAQCHAGTTGYDDGRQLQCAMQHGGGQGRKEQPALGKEGDEGTYYHGIVQNEITCSVKDMR